MSISKSVKLRIKDIQENLFTSTFNSDVLIAKEIKYNEYEIVALSLYGSKTDLQRAFRKNAQTIFEVTGYGNYGRYKFTKLDDYEAKYTDSLYRTRGTYKLKKDLMLDQSKEARPIVITSTDGTDEEEFLLKRKVFEEVRKSIAAPLFPDLTNPSKLSKELFITKEEAAKVIENVKNGETKTFNDFAAQDGIQKYKDWVEYLFDSLKQSGKIQELKVVAFPTDNVLAFEIVIEESYIREIVTDGLKSGIIKISNKNNHWNHYSKFDEYMSRYAKIFKQVIESQSEPLHRKGDITQLTREKIKGLGRLPIPAQIEAIEASRKSLAYQKRANIVGEPGVGKTFMMLTTAYLDAVHSGKKMKTLVLSPGHLVETTWEEEVHETFTNVGIEVKVHQVKSVKNLIDYEKKGYLNDDVHRVFILGQNAAKSGYSQMPAVIWDKNQKAFKCPDCFKKVTREIENEEAKYKYDAPKRIEVPVGMTFFATHKHNNDSCKHCGSKLWMSNNKKAINFKEFISNGENKKEKHYVYTKMGFIPNDLGQVRKEIEKTVKVYNDRKTKTLKSRLENLRLAELTIEGTEKERNVVSPRKERISSYIKKKLNRRFTHLIIDEIHEFQSMSSQRTEAAAETVAAISKVITGTGTMMNGYAKSRFYNDFMLFPEKMKRAGFNVDDADKYQVAFGVTENRFRLKDDGGRIRLSPKEKPGISPIIFPLFLQDSTVFISMSDLESSMPGLKHDIVEVNMSDELKRGKMELEQAVRRAAYGNKRMFKATMPTLYSYLDMPDVEKEVKDEEGNVVYTTKQINETNNHKLNELKRIVRDEKRSGRRTIVYTHYTGDGINNYLREELEKEGYRVTVLNKEGEDSYSCDNTLERVKKDDRETFVKEQVAKGSDILIVNPTLVQTGTNLIDFHSIVYYQMSYQVYTIRQADRRTWRIGQTEDCTIYYLYYKESFQADIASLMATKIVASESIEGKMDQAGLEAITNDRTPEEELAKKFFQHMDF